MFNTWTRGKVSWSQYNIYRSLKKEGKAFQYKWSLVSFAMVKYVQPEICHSHWLSARCSVVFHLPVGVRSYHVQNFFIFPSWNSITMKQWLPTGLSPQHLAPAMYFSVCKNLTVLGASVHGLQQYLCLASLLLNPYSNSNSKHISDFKPGRLSFRECLHALQGSSVNCVARFNRFYSVCFFVWPRRERKKWVLWGWGGKWENAWVVLLVHIYGL